MMLQHYCFCCGSPLERRMFAEENRQREVCPACDWVHYAHRKGSAGALVVQNGKLLLVRRANPPWSGHWNLPAGYMEVDETPRQAAERETWEETGLRVRAESLLDVLAFDDDPRGNGLLIVYTVEVLGGNLRGSSEGQEVSFFAPQDIPAQLAGGAHDKVILNWKAGRWR